MEFFRKAERVDWNQLRMQEQLVMLAMTAEPQRHVEWVIQRSLCYYKLGEITPWGLRLTHLGRYVLAERHGLPVVVGRDPKAALAASTAG